ncbi:MAG: hypothetical protein KDK70_15065 [Myxococcales bacterium]|nr:hypothetical protein [Myxococcales bacterium]
MAPLARSLRLALAPCLLAGACSEPLPEGGESFASAVVGPDGGQVVGDSVTLDIPPGALSTETTIELRRSDEVDIGLPGYAQSGSTVSLFPQDLQLELPAALTFADGRDRPAVIFEQDGLDVVALGQTAYINELTRAAAAVASADAEPLVTFVAPVLAATPDQAIAMPVHDTFRMELSLADPSSFNLDVVLSAYDVQRAHGRSLRGTGEGECGFRLAQVTGGSLRSDCSDSPFTGTVRTSGTEVSFDVQPFQADGLDVPVAVGVIIGSSEIAFQGGFLGFDTCTDTGC